MSKQDIANLVRAAIKHADQPTAPVHKLTGPSDERSAK